MFEPRTENFISPTKGKMSFETMIKEIKQYIDSKPGDYEIIVGCDSQRHKHITYVPAVVVRRIGRGGIYFYLRVIDKQKTDMSTRLINESYYSVMLAAALKEELVKIKLDHLFTEVHADINLKNKSSKVAKQITGMIIGFGFEPVIKPDGFVASYIADRHSKK